MSPGAGGRRWWTLAAACSGLFILMLDSTVVNLALTSIQADLDASTNALQWVVNGYLLTLSVLVVTLGRLGDMFGRRRVFVLGLALFLAGSALSAGAQSMAVLIAGRVIQGAGGAAMVTLSLAIVSHAFSDAERPRALGIWTAVSALALGLGPLVGGLVVESLGWRFIFWVNLPIAAAGIAMTLYAVAESRDETAAPRLDPVGVAVLSAGLTAVVLALVQGKGWGWTSPLTLAVGGGGIVLAAVFVAVERRVAQPIVDFTLFRNGPYFGASAAAFCLVGCYWGVIFFQPQYLQNVLGHSVVGSGLLLLPITVPMIVISPLAGALIGRFGTRPLMTAGMVAGAAAVAIQTRIDAASGYALLLPSYLLFGLALGLVYAPMSNAAMAAMPAAKAGIAAGVLAMNRMVAGALALAVMGALYQHFERDRLGALLGEQGSALGREGVRDLDGLLSGAPRAHEAVARLPGSGPEVVERLAREAASFALARATWALVALAVLGAVLTAWFVRSAARTGERPAAGARHHRFHF
jgi:EmrB/QacA subfamily drug resistance transporter